MDAPRFRPDVDLDVEEDREFDRYLAAGDEDEVLDTGPRRTLPRAVARLLIAGAGLVVLVLANAHAPRPRHDASPAPTPRPVVVRPSPVAASDVQAVLVNRRLERVYTVISDRLAVDQLHGDGRFAISSTALGGAVDSTRLRLVDNPADDVLWVVPLGSHGSHLLEGFDPRMLRRVARIRLPYPIDNATVLDGRLFLTYGPELLRVSADRRRLQVAARLTGSGGPLVADPSRHRLLYLDYYNPLSVRSWSPRDGEGATSTLPMLRGQLGLVGATIWAAGTGVTGGVLVRLDPRTLNAGPSLPVARTLRPGVVLAALGETVLFVRSSGSPDALACLDGRTGALLARWASKPGAVASISGEIALASPQRGVSRLAALGCDG